MTHLESARLKFDRAQEHIVALELERQRLSPKDGKSQPFTTRMDEDEDPNRLVIVVDTVQQPPRHMTAILGDVLSNLRSCLDHVAWQLCQRGGCSNLRPQELAQVQFPIYLTRQEFDDNLVRRLGPDLRSEHEAIVRRYQPYQRGNLAESHPVAVLDSLVRRDKHRYTELVWWSPLHLEFTATNVPITCTGQFLPGPDVGQRLYVNAKLAYLETLDRQACRGMKVQTRSDLLVKITETLELHSTVGQIQNTIDDLLSEIDRVL